MKNSITKYQVISIISVSIMLLLWKITALWFDSSLVVPHPEEAILRAIKLISDKEFALIAGSTILRALFGFFISFVLGLVTGIFAGISPGFDAFIKPIIVTFRSLPVISLILLALIWFNSGTVPIFIAFLTMFPFICTNVAEGVKSVDSNLVIMAKLYRTSWKKIIYELYIPAIMPFIISGVSSSMGIGWRAIIIGEVLSQPRFGIGTKMQAAQIFLNVDAVIAWTLIAVLISFGFEKVIRMAERKFIKWRM
ncbi:MAG: ABC transporter permease [Bacteroidales bacterium]